MTELIDRITETAARPVPAEAHHPLIPVAAEPHRPVFVDLTGRRRRGMRAIGFLAATACTAYVAAVGMTLSAERTGIGSDTVLEMITDAPFDVFEKLRDGAAELLDLWPDAVPASGPVLVAVPAAPAPCGAPAARGGPHDPARGVGHRSRRVTRRARARHGRPRRRPRPSPRPAGVSPAAPTAGEVVTPPAAPVTGAETPAQPDPGPAAPTDPVAETPVAPTDPGTTAPVPTDTTPTDPTVARPTRGPSTRLPHRPDAHRPGGTTDPSSVIDPGGSPTRAASPYPAPLTRRPPTRAAPAPLTRARPTRRPPAPALRLRLRVRRRHRPTPRPTDSGPTDPGPTESSGSGSTDSSGTRQRLRQHRAAARAADPRAGRATAAAPGRARGVGQQRVRHSRRATTPDQTPDRPPGASPERHRERG